MARHSNHEAAQRLGAALTELRIAHGEPSYRRLERAVRPYFAEESVPTAETIRRLHLGADPAGTSPELLLALARFYGVEPETLGPEVAERVAHLRALLGHDGSAALVTHRFPTFDQAALPFAPTSRTRRPIHPSEYLRDAA